MKFLSNQIPSILREKNFVNYIDYLLSFGINNFENVYHEDKNHLASLLVKSVGNDLFDLLDIEGYDDLDIYDVDSEIIISKIDDKFSDDINLLMVEIIENNNYESKIENGYSQTLNRKNGEFSWVRNY